jgi:hypothetical protein
LAPAARAAVRVDTWPTAAALRSAASAASCCAKLGRRGPKQPQARGAGAPDGSARARRVSLLRPHSAPAADEAHLAARAADARLRRAAGRGRRGAVAPAAMQRAERPWLRAAMRRRRRAVEPVRWPEAGVGLGATHPRWRWRPSGVAGHCHREPSRREGAPASRSLAPGSCRCGWCAQRPPVRLRVGRRRGEDLAGERAR